MNIFEIVTGKFSSSGDIRRGDVLIIGYVIVNLGGITSSYWTQVWANDILPAKRQVKHYETGNLRDCADRPFK